MLLLLSVTTSGRRTPFLLPPSVCLQKSLHDPYGPLVLAVDSVKPRAAILRILAGMLVLWNSPQTLRKVLIAQSSSSWYSVQSLRDHLFSLRVLNASPAKLVTCVA